MSKQRWDVMALREYTDGQGQVKTNYTKVGTAFQNQNGSINVLLDAIPMPGRDGCKLQLQVPMSREERQSAYNNGPRQQQFRQQGGGQRQRYQQQPQRMQAPSPPPEYPPQQEPEHYEQGGQDYGPDPDAPPFDQQG